MLFTVASTALLLLSLCPKGNSQTDGTPPAVNCTPETTAEIFQSAVYEDLISAKDPKILGMLYTADDAAQKISDENRRLLLESGVDNATAEKEATTVKEAVSLVDPTNITLYLRNSVIAIGGFLSETGLLDCDNVMDRATTYFDYEEKEFEGLDPNKIESYVQAIVLSIGDLLKPFEDTVLNWQRLADLFYLAYKKDFDETHA